MWFSDRDLQCMACLIRTCRPSVPVALFASVSWWALSCAWWFGGCKVVDCRVISELLLGGKPLREWFLCKLLRAGRSEYLADGVSCGQALQSAGVLCGWLF